MWYLSVRCKLFEQGTMIHSTDLLQNKEFPSKDELKSYLNLCFPEVVEKLRHVSEGSYKVKVKRPLAPDKLVDAEYEIRIKKVRGGGDAGRRRAGSFRSPLFNS